jgi:hypothetical protein
MVKVVSHMAPSFHPMTSSSSMAVSFSFGLPGMELAPTLVAEDNTELKIGL